MHKKVFITALLVLPMMSTSSWASEAELAKRIDKLERTLQGQGLVSLSARVDQLQNEVQRLNGDNESLRHELKVMEKRQRELYLDLDKRIQDQANMLIAPVAVPTTASATEPLTDTPPAATENGEATAAPEIVDNGEVAYQAAIQTLRSGQYEQAIIALEAFPQEYPQSSYLANVYYWQGEAHYVLQQFDLAIVAFQTVMDNYPKSRKVADATLKKGFSEYELEQLDAAQASLQSVIEHYPNTSAARLAKVRLDRIKQHNR